MDTNKIYRITVRMPKELRENLDRYNSIPGVQQTSCLAYVQRMISMEKDKQIKLDEEKNER